jgi:hypothetical protein
LSAKNITPTPRLPLSLAEAESGVYIEGDTDLRNYKLVYKMLIRQIADTRQRPVKIPLPAVRRASQRDTQAFDYKYILGGWCGRDAISSLVLPRGREFRGRFVVVQVPEAKPLGRVGDLV